MRFRFLGICMLVAVIGSAPGARAQSSISTNLTNRCAWAANAGWIDFAPTQRDGAVIGEFVCWGYLYSGNVGWIQLGNGAPTNGYQYSNATGQDFGINHDGRGNLRGLAWSANAGWLQFESTGAPSVNLLTGELSGHVWGANLGWISVSNAEGGVRTRWLDSGPDADGDGMPDMWEYRWVGSTGVFTSTSYTDADSVLDKDEYQAGTSPLNSNAYLRIVQMEPSLTPDHTDVTWTTELRRQYYLEVSPAVTNDAIWVDSGLGRLVPSGAVMTETSTNATSKQFWRVRPERPLAE
jgi:hypothetical protein